MTKRMQVLLEDGEYRRLQRIAKRHHMTLAEWVRPTLRAASREETDAEVLQEILHRYVASARRDDIPPAFDALLGVADDVLSITRQDAERAKAIALGSPRLSAGDAIHAAVMEHRGIARILSFASAFDRVPGITRLG